MTVKTDKEILDYLQTLMAEPVSYTHGIYSVTIGRLGFDVRPNKKDPQDVRELMSDAIERHRAGVAERVARALTNK